MNCNKCGSEIQDETKFCTICGNPIDNNPIQKKPKKRGCLIALLIFLVIVAALITCVAIFLPGFFRPKDLGIKTSKEAYESALAKLNYQKDAAPTSGTGDDYTYTYGDLKEVDTTLNSEELTSFFNYNRPKYYALKDVQIRINPDNTMEFSGAIDTEYFLSNVLGGEYSVEDIEKNFPLIKAIPGSVNVYAQLSGEIVDNKSTGFAFSDIEVMGVGLPSDIYETENAKDEIKNLIDGFLESTTEKTGGSYESIKIEDGELKINANLPSMLKREANE